MIKVFLSHSSKDKDKYVRIVANKLNKVEVNIEYDEFTFEAGEKTLNEIIRAVTQSNLFVFFISNDSLESDWVKKEILSIKSRLDEEEVNKFYPIIIDENIKHDDKRIPEWIQETYNLKYVSRPTVATKRIISSLTKLSYQKHPALQKKNNLCIGRNNHLETFEERIDDFEMKKPKCIIATGFNSNGRRTFLKYALEKTNLIDSFYKPNTIYLDSNDSIEDFILKIYDLGFSSNDENLMDLMNKSIEYKINFAISLLIDIQNANELLLILDNGCLVTFERKISSWFIKIISSDDINNYPVVCAASKYKIRKEGISPNDLFTMPIDELNISERKRLFKRLLEIYKLTITGDDFELISKQFNGFPEQVLFTVENIKRFGIRHVLKNLQEIREFNDEKASTLLKHHIENDGEVLALIRLLAQFEIISLDFLFSIVDKNIYEEKLDLIITENICEYFGYEEQFIRLNDSIRDYIIRNKINIKDEFKLKIKEHVTNFLNSDAKNDYDSSDYVYSIKEALRSGIDIEEKYLFPSHFLRTMKDLYFENTQISRNKVIELADRVLQKEEFIDYDFARDIRFYLCLALAKNRDKRVLKEAHNLEKDSMNFILGYYYRLVRRFNDALERLKNVVNSPYIMARAKRELIHVYIQTEGYSKALIYAKENYIENKENIYHLQLYFTCLIHSDDFFNHKEEIKKLALELELKASELGKDMGLRAKSLYLAKCESKEIESINIINDAVQIYSDSYYPLLTKFDIGFIFKNISIMEEAIKDLENHPTHSNKIIAKQKAYLIAIRDKDAVAAKQHINIELSNYPEDSKNLIFDRIDKFSDKNYK